MKSPLPTALWTVLILAALAAAAAPAAQPKEPADPSVPREVTEKAGWYEFNFPLDDTNLDGINLAGLLDPPAGKHGFVTVRPDGHFYFQDGARARFFGTNICGARAFPDKEKAPLLAARLAKYGVNLLRIHAVDAGWGIGLIDYSKGDTRHLSQEALDRLDFFMEELKKRGIYVYFDLLDYRRFKDADGARDAGKFEHGWQNSIKGATIFNDRLIELQKEFATNFLTHRSALSGLRYCDDPGVAVVEITNENSVFYFSNTALTLPSYVDELRERWNKWLLETVGDRPRLARAWTNSAGQCALAPEEDPAKGTVVLPLRHLYQDPQKAPWVGEQCPARVSAMVRFFFDLERRYYGEIRGHVKALGVKAPVTGTNQTFCPASVYADAANDFMARNNYWCHPNMNAKPFITFRNIGVVNSDLGKTMNPVTEVASSTVAGKPMISPEFNWPWPSEYRAECLPMMAAYACLQEWDGLLFFAYSPEARALEFFGNQSDPVRWGQFPAAALMFHRGDVAAAKKTVIVGYPEAEALTARPSHGRAAASPFRHLTYISKVRNAFYKDAYGGPETVVPGAGFSAPPQKRYESDTGELVLDTEKGLFTVNTPRSKAAIGVLGKAGRLDLGGAAIECKTAFAAVMMTSLDARPIGQSKRLLVTAVSRAENTGQAFARNKSAIAERGREPVLVEPVECRIALPMPAAAAVFPLDETGKRRARLPAQMEAGVLRIDTAAACSPWLEIVAE
ncbi:MAG: hypothetical protein FJ288_09415 [Planctomycetes bacterium]|nr:hypothetical protein [Planctomycetota bacterium]